MKLLKLVPDNTNLDFMRWRNLALVLSIIATVASLAYHRLSRPQPRRRLRRRPDDPGDLRAAGRRRAAAQRGRSASSSAKRASRSSAGRRSYPDPPAEAGGRRGRGERRREPRASDARRAIIRARGSTPSRRCRARSARSWRSDSAMAIALAMLGIAIYIWFRFEWQFGVGALLTLCARRRDDARLLRLHAAAGRPQRRRRVPDHRRLFAERHGRHLRPDPRESAQIPQDGDPAAAQPVAQRDAGADGGHVAVPS